jgi:thioredoxin 1
MATMTNTVPNIPVFAFFYADWCNVCASMRPVIDQVKTEYGAKIRFAYINVDEPKGREAAATFRVWALPTFLLVKPSGEIVGQWIGQQGPAVFPKAFDDLLTALAN